MPNQRSEHKKLLAGWIDKKIHSAFTDMCRDAGLNKTLELERILSEHTRVKPSDSRAQRTGIAHGAEGLKHGHWLIKPDKNSKDN